MFGTLVNDAQSKASLTFIENTNPVSALSLSRRNKPHISCKTCRSRKVRCSGQPSGCDRCVAVGAECRYPGREPRRRKLSATRRTDGSQDQSHAKQPSPGYANTSARHTQPQKPSPDIDMTDLDYAQGYGQRHVEQWLLSHSIEDEGSNGSSLDGWLDINTLGDPIPVTPDEGMDLLGNSMADPLPGEFEHLNVPEFDSMSTIGFPSPDILARQAMASPFGTVSPLSFSPAFLGTQPKDTHINNFASQSTTSGDFISVRSVGQSAIASNTNLPMSRPQDHRNGRQTSSRHVITSPIISEQTSILEPTARNQSKEVCRCLQLAARLLEEVGSESANNDPTALDQLLSCFRRSLMHCDAILDCSRCTSLSEINMLLATIGKYMSLFCERIVTCYLSLRREHQERRQDQDMDASSQKTPITRVNSVDCKGFSNSNGGTASGIQDIWFSRYHIEDHSERIQVVRCLVRVQLGEFFILLGKLKARAGTRKGHLALLMEAEKRSEEARSILRASSDRRC